MFHVKPKTPEKLFKKVLPAVKNRRVKARPFTDSK